MEENFDAVAAGWDDNPVHLERVKALRAAIESTINLQPHMHGIEIGCGTGLLGFSLLSRIAGLTFADNSRAMLERVRDKAKNFPGKVSILETDIANEELPESYDLILALMTFHHMPDVEKNVQRVCAHLNPGGYFCLADLMEDGGHFHKHRGRPTVYDGFKPKKIQELFAANRLQDIQVSIPYTSRDSTEKTHTYSIFLVSGCRPRQGAV